MTKPRVLFLCTHNSARSQMAEAFLRTLADDRFETASAGTEATRVHPLAIQAMREVGIDIAGQMSKSLDPFLDKLWDYVITVCDNANEQCPVFPGRATRIHWSFPDPSQAMGTDPQRLQAFCRVRDQIHARLRQWLKNLEKSAL
jgi:arsenate reductase